MNPSPEQSSRSRLNASPERQIAEVLHAKEVVVALVVVGFDTLGNSLRLPSAALADFASTLQAYELHRLADSPDTATQRVLDNDTEAAESDFLQQALEVMEAARTSGANMRAITAQLLEQSARFTDIERVVVGDAQFHSDHARQVWQHGLQEMLPTAAQE